MSDSANHPLRLSSPVSTTPSQAYTRTFFPDGDTITQKDLSLLKFGELGILKVGFKL
jgi:hypothetical protein